MGADGPDTVEYRPPGEVMVEIFRPIMRFGIAMAIGVRGHDGTIWMAQRAEKDDRGRLVWKKSSPGVMLDPLLEFDEEIAKVMLRALNDQPIKSRGDYALDHLADTMRVRDRLLAMVEQEWHVRTETGTTATRMIS